jgi:hypothetical protein
MKKRVRIPKQDPKALLDLATKLRAKHLADGDASPLKVLNWAELNPLIDFALQTEESALQHKRKTLQLYQQRARALENVTDIVRCSRDILAGVHRDEMKTLGLWGFDVMDSKVTRQVEKEVPAAA